MNPFHYPCFRLLPALLGMLACFHAPLARGDELTRQVQEELRKRNLYFGDVDGRYTAQIAAALRHYQERKGFAPSGQVDDTTLRSLSLAPVAVEVPPADTATAATAPVPPSAPPVPWPDLPVLHSDQGRENPPPPGSVAEITDPTPETVPKPPPAAAAERWPGETVVRSFVADYLRTGESNAPDAQVEFYGSRVDYFNEGTVDARFIAKDTARYNKRWPDRHFTLIDPVELSAPPEGSRGEVAVHFNCRFEVRQPGNPTKGETGKTVTGETKNTYVLERTGPDSMRIVSIKEERVRGK